jgi:hypothetical protein
MDTTSTPICWQICRCVFTALCKQQPLLQGDIRWQCYSCCIYRNNFKGRAGSVAHRRPLPGLVVFSSESVSVLTPTGIP